VRFFSKRYGSSSSPFENVPGQVELAEQLSNTLLEELMLFCQRNR
jgi:hypothetical protein